MVSGKSIVSLILGQGGAFHPKINLFLGDDAILVLFGSGNLTVAGHGKNHEVFTGFMIDKDDDNQRPLIEECWIYITNFVKEQCSSFDKNRILKELPENSILDDKYEIVPHQSWEIEDDLDVALLYNDDTSSILSQIARIVPFESVRTLTVISPFFDEDGETLNTLASLCPNANIEILMQEDCILPPCKMKAHSRIQFYNFDETIRGGEKIANYESRRLHAKILHFKTNDTEYCIVGSANATVAGLGTLKSRGKNEEFCVLYASDKRKFLNILGLKNRKKLQKNVRNMTRKEANVTGQKQNKYKIQSADYVNGKINIICEKNALCKQLIVVLDDGKSTTFLDGTCDKNGKIIIEYKLGNSTIVCYIMDENEQCISNRLFVNRIDELEATNPSQVSRNLNSFISHIENDSYYGLDITGMLSDIMWGLVSDTDKDTTFHTSGNNSTKKGKTLPNISYNSEYDNDEVHGNYYFNIDRTSKLIECVEESIGRKIRSIDEELKDEEETGQAEYSNIRTYENNRSICVKNNNSKIYSEQASYILNKYLNIVAKRKEQVRKTSCNLITKDDYNFFALSLFVATEICYLNRPRYQFLENIDKAYLQMKFERSLDSCILGTGLDAIENFTIFCVSNQLPPKMENDYEQKANRAMKYAILYATLFYKFASSVEIQVKENKLLKCLKQLCNKLGMPKLDVLIEELTPLSVQYDFVFRPHHIEKVMRKIRGE